MGEQDKIRKFEGRKKKKKSKLRIVIIFILLIFIIYFAVSAVRIVKLKNEKDDITRLNEELMIQKEDRQEKLEHINSKNYIENMARENLKLVRPNELLFILPEKGPADEEAEGEEQDE